jgi:hypothetical protein
LVGGGGTPKGCRDIADWMLVPSTLPPMELRVQRFASVRKTESVTIPEGFPAAQKSITIPANTKATFLLDTIFLYQCIPRIGFQ